MKKRGADRKLTLAASVDKNRLRGEATSLSKIVKMVAGECDPSNNGGRRPREYGRPNESEGELSDISDDDDVDEYSDEDDSDDDLEIPDDPEHEARMVLLRAENAALVEQSRQQEEILAAMNERTEKLKQDIERMKVKRAEWRKILGKDGEGGNTTASDANACKQFKEADNDKKKRGGDDEDQEQSGASATAPLVR